MRGTIPIELVREAKGGEVHVDMEDHRYKRPYLQLYWLVSLEVKCQTQVKKVLGSHPGRVLAETINLSISLLLCETLHKR